MDISQLTVYCDLDGVLVDLGATIELHTASSDWIEAPLFADVLAQIVGAEDGEPADTTEFWSNLPWTADGRRLWAALQACVPTIKVLSASPVNGYPLTGVKEGKQAWCMRHLGLKPEDILVVPSATKADHAGPNNLLIDDLLHNVDPWRKTGAPAILHVSTAETLISLAEIADGSAFSV